jgi:hypothetical protein
MFLFRPEIYEQDPNLKGKAEINVAKHRAGPLGTAQLAWLSIYTRFESVASDPVVDAALRN